MSTSAKPQRIFLSYAREDKRHVEKLAMFLKDSGHLVWWDQEIHAGIDYRQEIAEQLRTADKVIVIWSSHSVKSSFVIDEAQRANESGKLIPITMDVSEPPMGFGHLHAVMAADLENEFAAILAAIENRSAPDPGKKVRQLRLQKKLLVAALGVILAVLGVILYVFLKPEEDALAGLDPALDYTWYESELLGVRFPYPQAVLMADTTQENLGRIPLHSNDRKQEVLVTVTRLPSHNNVRIGRETELQALKEKGAVANYLGPSKESNWSDWYVISGITAEGKEFYFRRWFTDKDVVSVEFEYTADKLGLYNDVIGAMTTGGRFQIDTEKH